MEIVYNVRFICVYKNKNKLKKKIKMYSGLLKTSNVFFFIRKRISDGTDSLNYIIYTLFIIKLDFPNF